MALTSLAYQRFAFEPWPYMQAGLPAQMLTNIGGAVWCTSVNMDGWHSSTIQHSCSLIGTESAYQASFGFNNGPFLWTTDHIVPLTPPSQREFAGIRAVATGAGPVVGMVVELPRINDWPQVRLDPFKLPIRQPVPLPVPIPPGLLPLRPPRPDLVERPERTRPPRPEPVVSGSYWRPPRPPRRPEKEKKFKTQASAKLFMFLVRIMNFGTEAVDFVEAVWKALPKEMRSGKKISQKPGDVSLQQAVLDIYNGWDSINEEILGQALANLIENAVEDHLVGKFEKQWSDAMQRLGRRQTNRPGWQNAPGYQDLIDALWNAF